MPDTILDGTGGTYTAGVTDEHRLMTGSVSVSKEHHTNFNFQDSYNFLFDETPTGAGDIFLYLKNTGVEPVVCEGFNIHVPTNEHISVYLGAVGTAVGDDAVPANLYAGSAKKARGVFKTNSDITGLTGGVLVSEYALAASEDSKFRNFDADLVIPQNQTMYMSATTGGIQVHGFVVMWHDHGGV